MIPKVDTSMEIETNWNKIIYGEDNHEELVANTSEPLGKTMSVNVFVDASHEVENLTYFSHTGIIIYVNNTRIHWFSKGQNTVETYTFDTEWKGLGHYVQSYNGLVFLLIGQLTCFVTMIVM